MFTRDELQNAVVAALEPGNKAEGLAHIYHIQGEAPLWILPSLEIIQAAQPPSEAQFVAFQIVDRTLASEPTSDVLNMVRETLWARSMQPNPPFITNKLADSLTELFALMYPAAWPSFFENLLQLSGKSQDSSEVVAALLVSIHRKIGDQLFERTPTEHARANDLKDAIRTTDAESLVQVFNLLLQAPPRTAEKALEAFAGFSQWFDLQQLLPLMPLLHANLQSAGDTSAAAMLAICGLLAKKMPHAAKLDLIQATGVLEPQTLANPLIAHAVLLECSKILQSPDQLSEVARENFKLASTTALESVVKSFKACDDEELLVQLIPGLTEYLKASKVAGDSLLPLVLNTLIMKSKREELQLDDDFDALRQQLVSLQLLVFQASSSIFCSVVASAIEELITANDPLALDLALHELGVFGQLEPRTQYGSQLAALLIKITATPVCNHAFLAVPFVDLCARHADTLAANGAIVKALACVAEALKIQVAEVQVRAFRALHRLVKTALRSNSIDAGLGQQLLGLLEPLLGLDSDVQLYELCGLLVGVSADGDVELQKMFSVLCSQPDFQHLTPLASLIKGVVECTNLPESIKSQLQVAAQFSIAVVEQQPELIAPCRQIFSHILACLGSAGLYAETAAFAEVLVQATQAESISGLFSFVTQLMHAYRGDAQVIQLVADLAPKLFSKIFEILGALDAQAKEQQGSTDAEVERREAVSGFVQFVAHVVANGYGSVLSPELLNPVLSALATIVSSDPNRQNQRLAAVALTKLASIDRVRESDEAMQNLTGLCYAVPSNLGATRDMKPVVLELAALQHALVLQGSPEYRNWLKGFLESISFAIDTTEALPQFKQSFLKQQERLNING